MSKNVLNKLVYKTDLLKSVRYVCGQPVENTRVLQAKTEQYEKCIYINLTKKVSLICNLNKTLLN